MATKTLQIGVIGGGMIAERHMMNFAEDRRTTLRWLAEIDPKRAKEMGEKFAVPNLTADYRQMLADPELDAVVVCTPPHLHCKTGIDILRAKKHLVMEKPLTLTVNEARKLIAESAEHPELKVSGCSCRHARLNPKFAYVKKMIDDGKLGEVYFVHHRAVSRQGRGGVEYNPTAKWFIDRKKAGGGPLYDWGVYDLSFHLGILGEPEFLRAAAFCINGLDEIGKREPVFTVEEHGAAMMEFSGGLRYYWERANNANVAFPNQTWIYGTKGGIQFGYCSWDSPEIRFFDVARNGLGAAREKMLKVDMRRHKGDMPELGTAIIDYLCGDGTPPMPIDLEAKNLEIMHKVYKAAKW